jgi:mRNA interferase HigB
MPQITAQGRSFTCETGANLRQVLLEQGIDLYDGNAKFINCMSIGTCGTCAVQIEGEVSPVNWKDTARRSLPPHSIGKNLRKEASGSYPDVDEVVKSFYKKVEKSAWQNLLDVQKDYRDAEAVGNFTVFNLKGNKYRLILDIDYEEQVACFKYFLTYADYSKDNWKNDSYY